MAFSYKVQAIEAANRASARSAAVVHRELKRGLISLATIASTSPLLGLFGTVLGINNSFPAFSGDKASFMAVIFERLSHAFVPCALGLIVALVAIWGYNYLLAEVEAFDLDMENASLQLMDDLSHVSI